MNPPTSGVPVVYVNLSDPEPPVGTGLHVGSAEPSSGDRATFMRLSDGWRYAYGNDPLRPCTYDLVRFWLPARATAGPLVAKTHTAPWRSVPHDWMDDTEEAA